LLHITILCIAESGYCLAGTVLNVEKSKVAVVWTLTRFLSLHDVWGHRRVPMAECLVSISSGFS